MLDTVKDLKLTKLLDGHDVPLKLTSLEYAHSNVINQDIFHYEQQD